MGWNIKNINSSHKYTSLLIIEPKINQFSSHESEINICGMPTRVIIPQIKPLYEN